MPIKCSVKSLAHSKSSTNGPVWDSVQLWIRCCRLSSLGGAAHLAFLRRRHCGFWTLQCLDYSVTYVGRES